MKWNKDSCYVGVSSVYPFEKCFILTGVMSFLVPQYLYIWLLLILSFYLSACLTKIFGKVILYIQHSQENNKAIKEHMQEK